METKKVMVLGKEYLFVNEAVGNRSGFIHRSTLLENGYEFATAKVQYINRTWESYRYQTVMKRLVYNLIDSERESYLKMIKTRNGWSRWPNGRKAEYSKVFETSQEFKTLETLLNSL